MSDRQAGEERPGMQAYEDVDTAMVEAMKHDGRAKALVHSGGRLLTAEETARAAVGLVGSSRVVRSVPGWRAGLMHFTSFTPSVSMKADILGSLDGPVDVSLRDGVWKAEADDITGSDFEVHVDAKSGQIVHIEDD